MFRVNVQFFARNAGLHQQGNIKGFTGRQGQPTLIRFGSNQTPIIGWL